MIRFCEDLANNGVVGRYYRSNGSEIKGIDNSTGLTVKVNSLDVAVSEVHYTLFSKEEVIGNFGCPISQFTLFERIRIIGSLYRKVFPPNPEN